MLALRKLEQCFCQKRCFSSFPKLFQILPELPQVMAEARRDHQLTQSILLHDTNRRSRKVGKELQRRGQNLIFWGV